MEPDWKVLGSGARTTEYCKPGNTDLSLMFTFAESFVFTPLLKISFPSNAAPKKLVITNSSGQLQEFLLRPCHVDASRNAVRECGMADERWR